MGPVKPGVADKADAAGAEPARPEAWCRTRDGTTGQKCDRTAPQRIKNRPPLAASPTARDARYKYPRHCMLIHWVS